MLLRQGVNHERCSKFGTPLHIIATSRATQVWQTYCGVKQLLFMLMKVDSGGIKIS